MSEQELSINPSDENLSGENSSGEQPSDKQPSDRKPSDKQPSGKQLSDKQLSDKQPSDKQSSDKQPSDKQLSDKQLSDKQLSDKQLSDKQLSDKQLSDKQLSDKQPSDKQPSDKQLSDKQLSDKQLSDKQLSDKQLSDKQLSDKNSKCLFIGVGLSGRSIRALSGAASEMRAQSGSSDLDLRWVAPARYHLTLKYIGWVKSAAIPAIVDAVASAISGTKSFDMRCRNLDAFPNMEKAQVLWAGVDDRMGIISTLAKSIDSALGELGVEKETKNFVPHVTIARLKRPGNLLKLVQCVPEHVFSKSSLESLILYESSVESDASEFKKIATWPLE